MCKQTADVHHGLRRKMSGAIEQIRMFFFWIIIFAVLAGAAPYCTTANASISFAPIRLHNGNAHYLQWRGKPTILITSGEHYGAVLNRAFDYGKYLNKLESCGFNLTRTFTGAYCEPPGAFNIQHNTLGPAKGDLVCPWARSDTAGYANGGNKFDLDRWNGAYFDRLRDFVAEAGRRGVVVELVLFCPFYEEGMWNLSPMKASNNINGVGKCGRTEVYALKEANLQAVQDKMVRRIVGELKGFDNLYYEICNEPYFGGVTLEWQAHITGVITNAEKDFEHKHLIAQNIANNYQKIAKPNPAVSIFNFHYAKPEAASDNYGLGRVLGDDETGFAGSEPKAYRLEGWKFILAGGAIYDNLDYSFAVGHEDGTAENKAPGGGGAVLRKQLRILSDFINSFDFVRMRSDRSFIRDVKPKEAKVQALVDKGRAYAIYISGGSKVRLVINMPKGQYKAEWINTKTGDVARLGIIDHSGGERALESPTYRDDIALRIRRAD